MQILGPAPALIQRVRDQYQWQLVLLGEPGGTRALAKELLESGAAKSGPVRVRVVRGPNRDDETVEIMNLEVLQFPDRRLREVAGSVQPAEIDERLRQLARDMTETMYGEPGIGLAATQVGVPLRLIVMDIDWVEESDRNPRVLLNPEIIHSEGTDISEQEGCLSVPDFKADVARFSRVSSRAPLTGSWSSTTPPASSPTASSTRSITWTANSSSTASAA